MNSHYKKSGVDVQAGDELVDWLGQVDKPEPHHDRIVSGIGGFASLFRIGFPEMKKPLLVTCTDGVGTKVKLASHFQTYEGVAQDCVAMCVNDLICTGGMPLIFLDYYATGKLDLKAAKSFLQGLRAACHEANCALVGGETAEMPGVYQQNDFDCAGFAVGIVDEEKALGPQRVKEGDLVFALSSNGFHSNGFSLLRQVFAKDLDEWRDELLKPTALYVKVFQQILARCEIHAAAHITGGGIDNIPRVVPQGLRFDMKPWPLPEPFKEVQRRTQMSHADMLKTLNCGIGFVMIAPPSSSSTIEACAKEQGFKFFEIGRIKS